MANIPSPTQQGSSSPSTPQQGQAQTKPASTQQQGAIPVIRDWASI